RNARVVHYCGHMLLGDPARPGASEDAERSVRAAVGAELARAPVSAAYGSLACGADIVVAEELLTAGAELNVVLPFSVEDFVAVSVRHGGATWVPRFEACMDRAASVQLVTRGAYLGEPQMFTYGSQI